MVYDLIIVGAGLTGAVVAERFAKANKKVLVLEKRSTLGGNVFDHVHDGVLIHRYGPHIFHTNLEHVHEYMQQFWELNTFKNQVLAKLDDNFIELPFNFAGIDFLWPDKAPQIKADLLKDYQPNQRVGILELLENPNPKIQKIAQYIYRRIFESYSSKMWGIDPNKLDREIFKRVPIVIGYDNYYFSDRYQGIPKAGYSKTIKNMFDSPLVEIWTEIDGAKLLNLKHGDVYFQDKIFHGKVLITCALDHFFDYCFGQLPYRSLSFEFQTLNVDYAQAKGVINLPEDALYTRKTEYKHLTMENVPGKTVISLEQPGTFNKLDEKFNEPYYPLPNEISRSKYFQYANLLKNYKRVFLAGRLGLYLYLNMDEAIAKALKLAQEMLEVV